MSNPDVVAGYRAAKLAQLERFEASCNSADRSCTDTPEWREYFGVGEFAGSGTETLLTFKGWLSDAGRHGEALAPLPVADDVRPDAPLSDPGASVGISAESAFWLTGADLAELAAGGDAGAVREIGRRAAKRAAKRASKLAPIRLAAVS